MTPCYCHLLHHHSLSPSFLLLTVPLLISHSLTFYVATRQRPTSPSFLSLWHCAATTLLDSLNSSATLSKLQEDFDLVVAVAKATLSRNKGTNWVFASGSVLACYIHTIAAKAKLKVIDCGKPVDEAAWDIVTSHIPKLLTKPQASSLKPQAMGHEHSNFWDTYSVADAGNYNTWQSITDFVDLKGTRSCVEETNINLVSSDTSMSFLYAEKPHQSGIGSILIDSILQMMGFGMSSSTSPNWRSNFDSVLQKETNVVGGGSSNDSQIQKDWSPNNFSSSGGGVQVSTIDAFKPMNQEFSLDQQSLNSVVTSTNGSLSSGNFLVFSTSYGCLSTLIQILYEHQPQPQNSLFTNPSMSYGTCSNELSPTWSKVSSLLKPSMPKQQLSGLRFSNNTTYLWNSSTEALNDLRASVFASSQAQYQTPKFEEKPNCLRTPLKKLKREESLDAMKKNSPEPAAFKTLGDE
ncbi:hypothetical protein JHK82_039677 [Glycine max]|nr:hypothetical protein JHK86_039868 [Glycine max]KAG4965475.1 hypothetical protein JHK85_040450 [Glycine max]KAG5110454.1 hypothetical protein JHK82_039677 [Glycine max]KAG5121741.1 hypothetical protein JHK84_040081 [Glycine max]